MTPYRLTADAAAIVEEWLAWFRTGVLHEDTMLAYFRGEMNREMP